VDVFATAVHRNLAAFSTRCFALSARARGLARVADPLHLVRHALRFHAAHEVFPMNRQFRSLGVVTVVALGAVVALGGCAKPKQAQAQGDVAPAPPREGEGQITNVEVPGDKRALVVVGNASVHRPIVHLHGMCGSPREDLEAWGPSVAREHGTVIAVSGDVPCPDKPGMMKWSENAEKHDARILAAIDAVNASRGLQLDKNEVLLVGESMGAARAELLGSTFPERYPRLVLVGSPQTPSPENLRGVRAVANVAGEKEQQKMMKEGARVLGAAGKPTQFWELPGATHGQYGPEGSRIMSEAIGFVATK